MLLFAFFVSVVFAVLSKHRLRDQVIYGAKVFAAFIFIGLLIGWFMFPIPW